MSFSCSYDFIACSSLTSPNTVLIAISYHIMATQSSWTVALGCLPKWNPPPRCQTTETLHHQSFSPSYVFWIIKFQWSPVLVLIKWPLTNVCCLTKVHLPALAAAISAGQLRYGRWILPFFESKQDETSSGCFGEPLQFLSLCRHSLNEFGRCLECIWM